MGRPALLIDAENFPTGGLVVFTSHLARCLALGGYDVTIARLGPRTEAFTRPLGFGLRYQRVTPGAALARARTCLSLVTCVYWKDCAALVAPLLQGGVPLMLHDYRDAEGYLARHATDAPIPLFTNRASTTAWLAERGRAATTLGLPYLPAGGRGPAVRPVAGACVARIGYEKNLPLVFAANAAAPPEAPCYLYGSGSGGMAVYWQLTKEWPDWKARWYRGPFPREADGAVRVLRQARWGVDLSALGAYGGGAQYTFLEAWDADAGCVVHRDWLRPGDEMVDGVNCRAVADAAGLAALLAGPAPAPALLAGQRAGLAAHGPGPIVARLEAGLAPAASA